MHRHDYEVRVRQALKIRACDKPAGWDDRNRERKEAGQAEVPWPPPVPPSAERFMDEAHRTLTTGSGWGGYRLAQQILLIVMWKELYPADYKQLQKFRKTLGDQPISVSVENTATKAPKPPEEEDLSLTPLPALRSELHGQHGVPWKECQEMRKVEVVARLKELRAKGE